MLNTEQAIQNCVNWNIRQREAAKRSNDTHKARHHQQNIDQLNLELRTINMLAS